MAALFNLLAKLTLNKEAFDKDLDAAQEAADGFSVPTQRMSLDTNAYTDHDGALARAQAKADGFTVPDDIKLMLDTSDFDEAIESAEAGSSEFRQIWQDLETAVASSAISATISGIISYLEMAIANTIELASEIDSSASGLGMSTKGYQQWAYALGKTGASMKDVSGGLDTINKIVSGRTPLDKAPDAFGKLGVSLTDTSGKMRDAEDIFNDTMYALGSYEGDDRGALADAIFGNNSANLDNLFDKGEHGMKGLRQEAEKAGAVMSEDTIDSVRAYNEAYENLQTVMSTIQTSIGGAIIPGLTNILGILTSIMSFFAGGETDTTLAELLGIQSDTEDKLAGIELDSTKANTLIDYLEKLYTDFGEAAKNTEEWKKSVEELDKVLPGATELLSSHAGSLSDALKNVRGLAEEYRKLAIMNAMSGMLEEQYKLWGEKNVELTRQKNRKEGAERGLEGMQRNVSAMMPEYLKEYQRLVNLGGDSNPDQFLGNLGLLNPEDTSEWNMKSLQALTKEMDRMYKYMDETKIWDKDAADQLLSPEVVESLASAAEEYSQTVTDAETKITALESGIDACQKEIALTEETVETLSKELDNMSGDYEINIKVKTDGEVPDGGHAKGLSSVPYDNYLASLHRGEMVLTASQARRYREGSGSMDFSALRGQIVAAVRDGMAGASVNAYMDGERVSSSVNRRTSNQMRARRFAG